MFAWAGILGAMALILLTGFWMLYPYNIIQFDETSFDVQNTNHQVKQGEELIYNTSYCKNMAIGTVVTRSFVDGLVYTLPDVDSNRETGCHNVNTYVMVPKALPAGKYKLKILYRFKINPIRTIDMIRFTEPFEVIK